MGIKHFQSCPQDGNLQKLKFCIFYLVFMCSSLFLLSEQSTNVAQLRFDCDEVAQSDEVLVLLDYLTQVTRQCCALLKCYCFWSPKHPLSLNTLTPTSCAQSCTCASSNSSCINQCSRYPCFYFEFKYSIYLRICRLRGLSGLICMSKAPILCSDSFMLVSS